MNKLISLVLIIASTSFSASASDLTVDMTNTKTEFVVAEWKPVKPAMTSQIAKYAATMAVLVNATDEFQLYDGSSISNPFLGNNTLSAVDASKYMNGVLKDSETLYMNDGSKVNLDLLLNNNGQHNIIDQYGLDRLKDSLIGIGIDHATSGPGGLGGS